MYVRMSFTHFYTFLDVNKNTEYWLRGHAPLNLLSASEVSRAEWKFLLQQLNFCTWCILSLSFTISLSRFLASWSYCFWRCREFALVFFNLKNRMKCQIIVCEHAAGGGGMASNTQKCFKLPHTSSFSFLTSSLSFLIFKWSCLSLSFPMAISLSALSSCS